MDMNGNLKSMDLQQDTTKAESEREQNKKFLVHIVQ